MFNREADKVAGFLIVCKLYIKIGMREAVIEEQIQWVLLYVQGGSTDIWKKNILENLKTESLKYTAVGEFLADLKLWKNLYRSLEEQQEKVGIREDC